MDVYDNKISIGYSCYGFLVTSVLFTLLFYNPRSTLSPPNYSVVAAQIRLEIYDFSVIREKMITYRHMYLADKDKVKSIRFR